MAAHQERVSAGSRHGGDSYSTYSIYSLLVSSFLGLAVVYADDAIAEAPCPAEIGGFAFELTPAFHKVFANCRGTSLEIDTAADPHYDATGLGCFALAGVPIELGLGMPFAAPMQKWGQPAAGVANVRLLGHVYEVRFDPTVKATLDEQLYANRHGVYRSLMLETDGGAMAVELKLQ